jgi:hypothetical protein
VATEPMLTLVAAGYGGALWLTRRNVVAARSSPGLV